MKKFGKKREIEKREKWFAVSESIINHCFLSNLRSFARSAIERSLKLKL
jgi:hypothetical protein